MEIRESRGDCDTISTSLDLSLSISATPGSLRPCKESPPSSSITLFSPSMAIIDHEPSPIPLELLPVRPSSLTIPSSPYSCQQRQRQQTMPSVSFSDFFHGAIDMNQPPLSMDKNDLEKYSYPAGAGRSSDQSCSLIMKRDREQSSDAEQERGCEVSSRGSDDDGEGGAGSGRKKLRLSKDQSTLLEESFKKHSTLNPKQKAELAKYLNLRPRQVEVWFQNRRARTKLKQTEVDCELLKRCCETLTEENRRLQKEVQELRALKVAPPCVVGSGPGHDLHKRPFPAAMLTMCPSCERIATHTPDNTLTTAGYAGAINAFGRKGDAHRLHHSSFPQIPPQQQQPLPSVAC